MKSQALKALAKPIYNPETYDIRPLTWVADRNVRAVLSVNIGQEWAVYAGGRPLWHLSLSAWDGGHPVPVLRWSLTVLRRLEAVRDRIMDPLGTSEPLIYEDMTAHKPMTIIGTWRKPLSIEEINQMGDTPEVRARPGRP